MRYLEARFDYWYNRQWVAHLDALIEPELSHTLNSLFFGAAFMKAAALAVEIHLSLRPSPGLRIRSP